MLQLFRVEVHLLRAICFVCCGHSSDGSEKDACAQISYLCARTYAALRLCSEIASEFGADQVLGGNIRSDNLRAGPSFTFQHGVGCEG
jgi:hypothetical protein